MSTPTSAHTPDLTAEMADTERDVPPALGRLVLAEGIAEPEEIPTDYGVVVWRAEQGYTLARAAPRTPCRLATRHWMAMAQATPVICDDASPQMDL